MTHTRNSYTQVRILAISFLFGFCAPPALTSPLFDQIKHVTQQAAKLPATVATTVTAPIMAVTPDGVAKNVTTLGNPEAKTLVVGQVVGNTAALIRSTATTHTYSLPVVVTSEVAGVIKSFHPLVDLMQQGLRYNGSEKLFQATAVIWLQDDEGTGVHINLPSPVGFYISAPVDKIDPRQLEIDHVNQPFQEIVLAVATPGDNMTLNVKTTLGNQTISIPLPVSRPQLAITAAPESILAFGLESSTITVQALDPSLQGLPPIILKNTAGRLESTTVSLTSGNTGTTKLYSTAVGGATISSRSFPAAKVDTATVSFRFPVAFTLALILGGAFGAFLAHKRTITSLLRGVITGLVVGVLYVLGVNLLKITLEVPRASEAAAFVLAVLSAYFGPKLLDMLRPGLPSV